MARFSVVVPTRDRPALLAHCLEGIAGQTVEDVEVIVADNPTRSPARHVFERYAKQGWRYMTPPKPLAMHDNWEFAVEAATGEHVVVLTDKMVLHSSALEVAGREADRSGADVVTWWEEQFQPVDESGNGAPGRYSPFHVAVSPHDYTSSDELQLRYAMSQRRGQDPIHYYRGKIVFGAYASELIDRIRATTGRMFPPISPDYTSMVAALANARLAVDVGRPLVLTYASQTSTGQQCAKSPTLARRFMEELGASIISSLPIPGLYSSTHNVVAYDLMSSGARLPAGSVPDLNMVNLLRRAREDLATVNWASRQERDAQFQILIAHERRHCVQPVDAIVDLLPVAGVDTSTRNVAAFDDLSRQPTRQQRPIDMLNLLRQVREDLDAFPFENRRRWNAQHSLLEECERQRGIVHADSAIRRRSGSGVLSKKLAKAPRVNRAVRKIAHRPLPIAVKTYESVVDAAHYADEYHTRAQENATRQRA